MRRSKPLDCGVVDESKALRLSLLGRFLVERRGREVRLPTRESRLLLAYLALHPQSHPREKLAARFWPEVPDDSARASLRNALSTLRRLLGRELLDADRESVGLNPDFPIWVDALSFRRQASRFLEAPIPDPEAVDLGLYAGDLLVDAYDDWVLAEREAIRELYRKTLSELTQQMRSKGEYGRAIEFARRVLDIDPADERAHQQLMFCHVALGDRPAALRQYEACRRALDEELAVAPSAATRQLQEWIQQAQPERLPVEASITNLPIPATAFIGRQGDMAAVKEQIGTARLVTLTGAGGSGKTRLAIQVATDLLETFVDGVWWVELGALPDADLLPRRVAKTLGVPEVPDQPVVDTLANFLRTRRLLLVLDNCEHLVAACAGLVEHLLGSCPELSILATSRERLGINGEHVRPVGTLSLPGPGQIPPVSDLMKYEAIDLFVRRAKAVSPDFRLTGENAGSVVEICRRLDGLPLALELAAGRAHALTPDQMAARLDDAFQLLASGSRTALPHHETLRGAIDWSHALLSEPERILFRRVSVFAGGWTLPAAETVCAGEGLSPARVADLLSRLVDKSLVDVRSGGAEKRFRLLETIRQYAAERLAESGEAGPVRKRHLDYFVEMVESADPHMGFMMPEREMDQWTARMESEQDNIRAALSWCMSEVGESDGARPDLAESGLRLLSPLHAFWFSRGRFAEGRAWLNELLGAASGVSVPTRARALITAGYLACWQGDFTAARPSFEEALALFRELDHGSGMAFATHGLGFTALGTGDGGRALSLFEESLRMARDINDKWVASFALHFQAIALTFQGEYGRAAAAFEEGNELVEAMGGHRQAEAFSLFHLGRIARLEGDYRASRSRHAESARLFREAGDRRGIGYSLAGLAALAAARGDSERAARLAGAVAAVEDVLGSFLEAPLQIEYERELAAVRDSLGEEIYTDLKAEGGAMTMEQAIEHALES